MLPPADSGYMSIWATYAIADFCITCLAWISCVNLAWVQVSPCLHADLVCVRSSTASTGLNCAHGPVTPSAGVGKCCTPMCCMLHRAEGTTEARAQPDQSAAACGSQAFCHHCRSTVCSARPAATPSLTIRGRTTCQTPSWSMHMCTLSAALSPLPAIQHAYSASMLCRPSQTH